MSAFAEWNFGIELSKNAYENDLEEQRRLDQLKQARDRRYRENNRSRIRIRRRVAYQQKGY